MNTHTPASRADRHEGDGYAAAHFRLAAQDTGPSSPTSRVLRIADATAFGRP
jgi:hypothetical protein